MLHRNCLLKHVTEENIEGRIEVTGIRGRRRKQLLNAINPLTTERIYFIKRFNAYRAVNTLHFGYKNQSINVLQGKSRCLF
jgi:hypothetical protein